MSLVSTYVRATDGLLYRNPTLRGKDWFICFDDDDPVELVIKTKSNIKPKELLTELGIKYEGFYKGYVAGRYFNGKVFDARSYFFEITNRLNPKHIAHHDGTIKRWEEAGQGVFYDPKV